MYFTNYLNEEKTTMISYLDTIVVSSSLIHPQINHNVHVTDITHMQEQVDIGIKYDSFV